MEEEAEKLKKLQSQVDQEMSNTPVLSSPNCSKTSMLVFIFPLFPLTEKTICNKISSCFRGYCLITNNLSTIYILIYQLITFST